LNQNDPVQKCAGFFCACYLKKRGELKHPKKNTSMSIADKIIKEYSTYRMLQDLGESEFVNGVMEMPPASKPTKSASNPTKPAAKKMPPAYTNPKQDNDTVHKVTDGKVQLEERLLVEVIRSVNGDLIPSDIFTVKVGYYAVKCSGSLYWIPINSMLILVERNTIGTVIKEAYAGDIVYSIVVVSRALLMEYAARIEPVNV
jgi:hypothetical protein